MLEKSEIFEGLDTMSIKNSLEAIRFEIQNGSDKEENINQEKYTLLKNFIFPVAERFVGVRLERISLEEAYKILNALKIMKTSFTREEFIRVFSSRKIDFTDFMSICDEYNRAEQIKDFTSLDSQIFFMGELKILAQSVVIDHYKDSYGNLGTLA